MSLRKSPTMTPARLGVHHRNAWKSMGALPAWGKVQSRMNSLQRRISCESVKKFLDEQKRFARRRRVAEAEKKTKQLFVANICALASRHEFVCFFTPSCGTGQGGSRTGPTCAPVNCRAGRHAARDERRSALRHAKRILFSYVQSRNVLENK